MWEEKVPQSIGGDRVRVPGHLVLTNQTVDEVTKKAVSFLSSLDILRRAGRTNFGVSS